MRILLLLIFFVPGLFSGLGNELFSPVVFGDTKPDKGGASVELKDELVSQSQVNGGLIVHLGCPDEKLIAAFASDDRFVAHGLTTDDESQRRMRAALNRRGLYGKASVERLSSKKLPYADQLVRLLVVEETLGVPQSEFQRVLCPGGLLYAKESAGWSMTVKPWPESLDQWTHIRHGADNNAVSHDQVVGPPTNVRWISDQPRGQRGDVETQAIVTSAGRMFVVTKDGKELSVVARDAFSGIPLWRRSYSYKLPGLSYRTFWRQAPLLAIDDRVYLAGRALDASTGRTSFTFSGDPKVCADGILVTSQMAALDAETGRELWRHPAAGQGMVIAGGRLYFVEGAWPETGGPITLVCLELKTGKEQWRRKFDLPAPANRPAGLYDGYSPNSTPNGLLASIVHHRGVLALEVTRTYIYLFSAADGKHIRSLRYKNWAPYASGLRALMIDGRLWLPEYIEGERFDHGCTINAYDLTSGEKVKTLKLETPVRQRCRPPLASQKYFFLGGMNFVDINSSESGSFPVVRSACHIGLVPANGLLYVAPTHCRCYSMIPGYVALECRSQNIDTLAKANNTDHLHKGAAYGNKLSKPKQAVNGDWPTFRQDSMRRAHVPATLPGGLKLLWENKLSSESLSPPVVADKVAVVSLPDSHRIEAMNVADGSRRWSFVAGGRIYGSPTITDGACVFGCTDGWVYAVRLSDGELMWRNLAAPTERRIMVSGQLESAWPALGSVTVAKGTVCAVAGRHNMAEGGIVLTGFNLHSGRKQWQIETPHRDLLNPLSGGAYENISKPYTDISDPRPSAGAIAGWFVNDGSSVQIDRLGAFDAATGKQQALFDKRLDSEYRGGFRPLKNRSPRPDFGQWLLSADDGKLSCRVEKGKPVQVENAEATPLIGETGTNTVTAIASTGADWIVLAKNANASFQSPDSKLIIYDKATKKIRQEIPVRGQLVPHGLAVAGKQVFVTTMDGRLLCFGIRRNTK